VVVSGTSLMRKAGSSHHQNVNIDYFQKLTYNKGNRHNKNSETFISIVRTEYITRVDLQQNGNQ
jgi:hypothetical protein